MPKPEWLKVRAPGSANYLRLRGIMRDLKLHTVCEEAHCPNIGECWHHGTATFMIMGDVCTRACGYCNVAHGAPGALDPDEPDNLARAVQALDLAYVVVTSVDRDDLEDFGAGAFAATVRAIKARQPSCRVEVLVPDFQGHEGPLRTVSAASPDILNHNIETVPRLYRVGAAGRPVSARAGIARTRPRVGARRFRRRPASWWASARRGTRSSRCCAI